MSKEEIEEAIKQLQNKKQLFNERKEQMKRDTYHSYKEVPFTEHDITAMDKVFNYISELEEKVEKYNKQLDLDYVDNNFISKDVIREKIKEIEEIPDQMVKEYGIPEESKNIFLNEKGIQVLKELLDE